MKIQIMGRKVCLRRKGKTLLCIVNKLLKTKSQHLAMFCLYTFPAHNLTFHLRWRWWDQIKTIFSNLFYFSNTFSPLKKIPFYSANTMTKSHKKFLGFTGNKQCSRTYVLHFAQIQKPFIEYITEYFSFWRTTLSKKYSNKGGCHLHLGIPFRLPIQL